MVAPGGAICEGCEARSTVILPTALFGSPAALHTGAAVTTLTCWVWPVLVSVPLVHSSCVWLVHVVVTVPPLGHCCVEAAVEDDPVVPLTQTVLPLGVEPHAAAPVAENKLFWNTSFAAALQACIVVALVFQSTGSARHDVPPTASIIMPLLTTCTDHS